MTILAILSRDRFVARLVSGLLLYSLVLTAASYGISRYYSQYEREGKLVINDGIWGFMSINLTEISSLKLETFSTLEPSPQVGDKSLGTVSAA